MVYEMRALKTGDIFKVSKILKKMDLKIEVEQGMSQEAAGAMLIQKLLENIHLAEKEVNTFLGELIGLSAKEFSDLPISETINIIEQFKNQENIGAFLKLAGK